MADDVVVVVPAARWEEVRRLTPAGIPSFQLLEGGARRRDSVAAALGVVVHAEVVVVHDAARPLCPPEVFHRVVAAARRHGAATAGIPVTDTVKRVDGSGRVLETVDRSALVAVQTPQAFLTPVLLEAHATVPLEVSAVDDCALVEATGGTVIVVEGDPTNVKLTHRADVEVAAALLRRRRTRATTAPVRPGTEAGGDAE